MPTSSRSETAAVTPGAQLTFFLGEEEYGVPLARVSEIAPDEGVTRVPGAPDLLRGVIDVRGVPVAVVDLLQKFGVARTSSSPRRSLVVVEAEVAGPDGLMAISVDRISRVITPRPEDVESVPALSSGIRVEFLQGMVRSEGGFVLLMDVERVLSATEQEALSGCLASHAGETAAPKHTAAVPEGADAALAVHAEGEARRRFVIVRTGDLRCGVDASWVQEVTPAGGVTAVPGAAAPFYGLHNLRGNVVPVLDLALAMGQPPFAAQARSAFLVVDSPGGSERGVAALAVEAIAGMVEIGGAEIETVPAFAGHAPAELVEGAALSLGQPMLILHLNALLSE